MTTLLARHSTMRTPATTSTDCPDVRLFFLCRRILSGETTLFCCVTGFLLPHTIHGHQNRCAKKKKTDQEGESWWALQGVISRAFFRQQPRSGPTSFTVMSLHINNFAKAWNREEALLHTSRRYARWARESGCRWLQRSSMASDKRWQPSSDQDSWGSICRHGLFNAIWPSPVVGLRRSARWMDLCVWFCEAPRHLWQMEGSSVWSFHKSPRGPRPPSKSWQLPSWGMAAPGLCWQSVCSRGTRKTRAAGPLQRKVFPIPARQGERQRWRWKRPLSFIFVFCTRTYASISCSYDAWRTSYRERLRPKQTRCVIFFLVNSAFIFVSCFIACHTAPCAYDSCKVSIPERMPNWLSCWMSWRSFLYK